MELYDYEMEAAKDDFIADILNELGPEWAQEQGFTSFEAAVEQFRIDRLQSYYENDPGLATPCFEALNEARHLLSAHPSAALVFATTAIELTIKIALLTPIVYGLVHTEAFGAVIVKLSIKHNGMDRFKDLLNEIVKRHGGFDLHRDRRNASSAKSIFQEIEMIQELRNGVVHRGKMVSNDEALTSFELADWLLNDLFPRVLLSLELYIHPTFQISRTPISTKR